MINPSSLVKAHWGEFWAIGGKPQDIQPLDFSLYNFNGINSTELLDIGSPDIFQYLLVTRENYILARSKNIVINLEWNYKGANGKLPWGLSIARATKEFDAIKVEEFLISYNFIDNYTFNLDNITQNLQY